MLTWSHQRARRLRFKTRDVFLVMAVLLQGPLVSKTFAKQAVETPPTITSKLPDEISFKERERVELQCEASGKPPPSYIWKKDGEVLSISGIDIRQLPGVGTIVIEDPTVKDHEGTYQCFARNEFGAAVSARTTLKKAFQDPFPSVREPLIHRPPIGAPLTLRCNPPAGYPKGVVYWGEYKSGAKLKPIENSERVSLDYDGNLHFANIEPTDDRKGLNYVCIVQNMELRSLMQGDDQRIEPSPASPRYEAPRLMWSSKAREVAIRGQSHKLKCIFSGYPTPRVSWTKVGSSAADNTRFKQSSFGQELIIDTVELSDEGSYECTAVNNDQGVPKAIHRTNLVVESPPYWKNDRPPEDVSTSEDESAQFNCEAEGKPTPAVSWLINGEPIETVAPNRRRVLGSHYLRYVNVTKSDAQVLQCNVSNKHGYIFANAYLNVLAEPPSFIESPALNTKVAEGQSVVLNCQAFGAPKPVIEWSKDKEPLIADQRFSKDFLGNLHITNVRREDAGRYYCHAHNKFGDGETDGMLVVRERTEIVDPPLNQTVTVATDVTLKCSATTDPDEKSKLRITWMKYGYPIDLENENNVAMNVMDKSLRITQARVENTGSYTCNASNGLDSDAATAFITVKDRPDPPYDVRWVDCRTTKAEIAWSPGSDNNDPINEYVVYYNTSFDGPDHFTEGVKTSGIKLSAQIPLRPWTNYTFHVVARNSLGPSDRSAFTGSICSTPAKDPDKNPTGVCSESREPNQLVIVWDAMSPRDHNGDEFAYVVKYKRIDIPNAQEIKQEVREVRMPSTRRELVVEDQEMYKEYEISVQAKNQEGLAPGNSVERRIGYSGQGVPLDQPLNLRINQETLNSTYVEFLWDPVDESVDKVKGFFKGYRIKFWKSNNELQHRFEDVILRSWQSCPNVKFQPPPPSRRRRDSAQPVKGRTNQLWPYTTITAAVSVLNAGGKVGPLSDPIEFTTQEGVPSAVRALAVIEKGSNHFVLTWKLPDDFNGRPTGYLIEYKKAPPAMGQLTPVRIDDIHQTQLKIVDLDPDTPYIVYIWATTAAGKGDDFFTEDTTNKMLAPSPPMIDSWEAGDNYVNLTWNPTSPDSRDRSNPGHKFAVEYRKAGTNDEWKSAGPPEQDHNWMNVTDLETGSNYEFRIVAQNNGENSTASKPEVIYVGARQDPIRTAEVFNWILLVIILCIFLLLLLVLLIIFAIWRNRGGKYAVHEKEKLRGHDSNRDEDDAGFGEYTRTEEPHRKSQASVNSDEKPLDGGSDTDSLGEYEDPDPSKFNEDGSFIGQYGGKKKGGELIDQQSHQPDGTTPSALSTFV